MSTQPITDIAPPADRWLNAEEAGQYARYSAYSIRTFCKRGLIRHTKGPRQTSGYRFHRQWIDNLLESRAVEAKQTPRCCRWPAELLRYAPPPITGLSLRSILNWPERSSGQRDG